MMGRLRKARRHLEEVEGTHAAARPRSTPSLAHDVVVAALDPDKGKLWRNADFTVAAAILAELAHEGRLKVSGAAAKTEVTLHDSTPLGEEILDDALVTIGGGVFGKKVTSLVSFLPTASQVLAHLASGGVVTEQERRVLGLLPVRRYFPMPVADRDRMVADLRRVLLGESAPDDRMALMISALDVAIPLTLFVPREHLDQAHGRAGEIRRTLSEDEGTLVQAVKTALSIKESREA